MTTPEKKYVITQSQIAAALLQEESDGFPNTPLTKLFESLPELSSEPVAWHFKYDTDINKGVWGVGYNVPKNSTEYHPLYTSPQALQPITELEKDAARYQWLRKNKNREAKNYTVSVRLDVDELSFEYRDFTIDIDAAIDAAIARKESL